MPEFSQRQRLRLDRGWLFHRGDLDTPLANKHIAAYMNHKAGWARGAARGPYDDSDWPAVDLPHDWSVEGTFDPANHLNSGYLPRGIGWYRRHFAVPEHARGQRLVLRFDGVATHCTVYVNGHLLHRNWCGYTPFSVDFTDVATFGEQLNTVAVRVDATYMEGWWYEGAGLYRHVYLEHLPPVHLDQDELFVRAERLDDRRWRVAVDCPVHNHGDAPVSGDFELQLIGPDGSTFGGASVPVTVEPGTSHLAQVQLTVEQPLLWSLQARHLYRAVCRFAGDRASAHFGFRTIRFDPDRGFFLNDQHVLLKGTCNHQDHAGVGVAVPDAVQRFRIQRLIDMGSNAYRTGHHPPAPQVLEACDELGMLVLDENRSFGSSPEHLQQLRAMVRRDRNHPSVIAWCLCNEEPIQTTPVATQIARTMAAEVRRLDPTRPVTAAVSGGLLNDNSMADVLDVMSINYQLAQHDPFHAKHPRLPVLLSETHCAYGTRGVTRTDPEAHRFAADDSVHAPWGASARATWKHVLDRPWLAGLFAWTGFDYRGEPSPHDWPSVLSHWGILDLCGFDKQTAFLHRAFWSDRPFVQIGTHWNAPAGPGETVSVRVYTNGDRAELLLNGRSLGSKPVDPVEMAQWDVPYEPGALVARAYHGQTLVGEQRVETTGPAVALGLEVHPSATTPLIADGHATAPVTVFALDEQGRRVPDAVAPVEFAVEGAAHLLGVGNGDPTSHEPDKAPRRRLFNGLVQVLVQAGETAGEAVIDASSPGLRAARLTVPVLPPPADAMASVPVARPRYLLNEWRMSPVTTDRPDPTVAPDAADMNTWLRVQPGPSAQRPFDGAPGYAIYRATAKLPKRLQTDGARLAFHDLAGEAEVYIDGRPAPLQPPEGQSPPAVRLPPGTEPRSIAILVQSKGSRVGLAGAVELLPVT